MKKVNKKDVIVINIDRFSINHSGMYIEVSVVSGGGDIDLSSIVPLKDYALLPLEDYKKLETIAKPTYKETVNIPQKPADPTEILTKLKEWEKVATELNKPLVVTIEGKKREVHPGAVLVLHPSKKKDLCLKPGSIYGDQIINIGIKVRFSAVVPEDTAIMLNPFIGEDPKIIFFSEPDKDISSGDSSPQPS